MSTTEPTSPADRGSGSNDLLGALVACPLCGAGKGYSLRPGSTYRWWRVSCAACGDEMGECRADGMMRVDLPPPRHPYADTHWQRVGARAQKLRDALVLYMAAGVGNSTDHEKQAQARLAALNALSS